MGYKVFGLNATPRLAALGDRVAILECAVDGSILAASDKFLELVGYRLNEIVGQHHSLFVPPALRDGDDYRYLWERLRRGTHVAVAVERIGKGGRTIWLESSYSPVPGADGQLASIIEIASDIPSQRTSLRAADQGAPPPRHPLGRVLKSGRLRDDLAAVSRKIVAFSQTIDEISGQINLLTLNANIEALGLGEAGKRFAAMARELRTLLAQTEAVKPQIGDIRASVLAVLDHFPAPVESSLGPTSPEEAVAHE